ncbi:MAG: TIGR03960 family B12-binding radical SAM protein [Deltaproteobacteria bacterium]|nr:TIGR03960 family B12-binding radical SAM protein [Deltaproteobacteria bacterium]
MSLTDHNWFSNIRRPSRYIGNEINCRRKNPADIEVSIVLAFPDVYEVGMSHQGMKILYHLLNIHEWLSAERVFSPWVDLERQLRSRVMPLASLESGKPLKDFDIIGFSLQHELSYTNVLNILDLSGIPLLAKERDDSHPLIIAGGPACFNPEPVAEIFDCIVIGDGEELAVEICRTVREAKKGGINKIELLKQLAKKSGIYIPGFFKIHYKHEGTIELIEPLLNDYTKIKKAIVPDINAYPFPVDQVVPFTQLVHDRLAIEIARGCTRGCRFCQAGMIYRPVRERSPDSIMENINKSLISTGFEEVSLLSLSTGDYSCIAPLLIRLMDRYSSEKIAVSLPSLRVDTMDPSWLEQIKRVRKTGFTMAPEVGSDEFRNRINKSLTNEDIMNTSYMVYNAGWNLIKLYFMIGLPGEKENDLHDIIRLAKDVSCLAGKRSKKVKLNASISSFVPKSHTPFMWEPQIELEESRRRIDLIRHKLRNNRSIKVKWNQSELSWLEGIFSRGDRRLARALADAWRNGARFDSWSDQLRIDIWKKAFQNTGIEPDFYLHRSRSMDEILPWEHIESGVAKRYFKAELENALKGKITPDCRLKCHECGVCDHKFIDPLIFNEWAGSSKETAKHLEKAISPGTGRYLVTYSKTGALKYLSHLELARSLMRAFKRAGLNIAFSKGFHPMPKISFVSALPVGTESMQENLLIDINEINCCQISRKEINKQLPDGLRVISVEKLPENVRKISQKESHYHISLNKEELDPRLIEKFLRSPVYYIEKTGENRSKKIDARHLVTAITVKPPRSLILKLRHDKGPELKPVEIMKAVLELDDSDLDGIKIVKTRQIISMHAVGQSPEEYHGLIDSKK